MREVISDLSPSAVATHTSDVGVAKNHGLAVETEFLENLMRQSGTRLPCTP